jgi:hypothetical protein
VFLRICYYYEALVWREFICNKSRIIGGGEIRELLLVDLRAKWSSTTQFSFCSV